MLRWFNIHRIDERVRTVIGKKGNNELKRKKKGIERVRHKVPRGHENIK